MTITSAGAPTPSADDSTGITVDVAPAPTVAPTVIAADEAAVPSPRPEVTSGTMAGETLTAQGRLRAALPVTGPGLTGPGGVILGGTMVGLGALVDVALGNSLGLGFTATFLLGCVLVAVAVRTRALATAVVLPPLLFAAAALLETTHAGVTTGSRQTALDVATTLALSAPLLFLGTALTLVVVLARLVVHAVRR
jgi:uncharacterized protein DUF6542